MSVPEAFDPATILPADWDWLIADGTGDEDERYVVLLVGLAVGEPFGLCLAPAAARTLGETLFRAGAQIDETPTASARTPWPTT